MNKKLIELSMLVELYIQYKEDLNSCDVANYDYDGTYSWFLRSLIDITLKRITEILYGKRG